MISYSGGGTGIAKNDVERIAVPKAISPEKTAICARDRVAIMPRNLSLVDLATILSSDGNSWSVLPNSSH